MTRYLVSALALVLLLVTGAPRADADAAADRASLAGSLDRVAKQADTLLRDANDSDDRAVRKKFAPRVEELADDLEGAARKVRKDASWDAVRKELQSISRDASDLVDLADEAEDKAERRALRQQATQLETGVTNAIRDLDTYAARREEARKAPAKPQPMSADAFRSFLASVRNASFDSDKVATALQGAQNNWFTSQQVASTIELISFDSSKVDAAAGMWSRIVDPENSHVIFNKLSFSSSKDALRKRVAK